MEKVSREEQYYQQYVDCGKPACRACREGKGHGPYWYAYRIENGQTKRSYIGRDLPPGIALSALHYEQGIAVRTAFQHGDQSVRLFILGSLRLERRTGTRALWLPVTDLMLRHRAIRGLLACLLSAENRRLSREQIIESLWPDSDLDTARHRLDQAVYGLRQLLEPTRDRHAAHTYVLTEYDQIILADQTWLWCDANAFEAWLHEARRTRENGDPGKAELLLEKALPFYRGPYLSGCLGSCLVDGKQLHLADARRDMLRRLWIGGLLEMADLRIGRLAYAAALEPLEQVMLADGTNEAAVQRLMRVLFWLDRRDEALQVYRRLSAALQQVYGVSPLVKVRTVSESILAGEWNPLAVVHDQERKEGKQAQKGKLIESYPGRIVSREQEMQILSHWITTAEQLVHLRLREGTKPALVTDPDASHIERCLLLLGEIGIGKTLLAREAARIAKKRGWMTVEIRLHAQERLIPYGLWTRLLREILMRVKFRREDLTGRPLMMHSLKTLLPELILPSVTFSSPPSKEQAQLRLWESICRMLTLMAQSTPLFLVLDDLHFADEKSSELLAYVVRRWVGTLFVGTCRKEELTPSHPLTLLLSEYKRQTQVKILQLAPLPEEGICSIVSRQYANLPERVVQSISARAVGNPYFAEELARALQASLHDKSSDSTDLIQELDSILPNTIADIFERSLNHLGKDTQYILAKATAFGTTFTLPHLCALDARTSGAGNAFVLDALEEALRVGLLRERTHDTRTIYQFWHPLLVGYLSKSISAERRAQLQRHVAAILTLL